MMAGPPFAHGSFGSPQQPTVPVESAPAPEERQWLIDPEGRARTLPAHQVERATQEGYRLPVNVDEIAVAREREKVADEATQGFMGGVNSLVEGAARAIPGADYLARKGNELLLGNEQADLVNEAVKARSKTDLATAGEVAGNLALVLGTGGASAAARSGGVAAESLLAKLAARNPVALINRGSEAAGLAAEKLVAKAIPSRTIGTILAKGAALGTEGALQGAVTQVGHNINEAALGDHELNAEKLLAGVPEAALFGGSLGATLGIPLGIGKAAVNSGKAAVTGAVDAVTPRVAAAGSKLAEASLKPTALDYAAEGIDLIAKGKTSTAKAAMATHSGILDAAAGGISKLQSVPTKRVRQSILDRAIDGFANAASVASGTSTKEIKVALKSRSARLDAINYEDLQSEAFSRLRKGIGDTKAHRAVDDLLDSDAIGSASAASQVRPGADVLIAARGKLDEIAARVDGLGADGDVVRPLLERARGQVANAGPGAEGVAFSAIDELRRGVNKLGGAAQDEVSQELAGAIARDTDAFLSNAEVWGPAAANHQRVSTALREYRDSKSAFDDLLLKKSKNGTRELDEGKLAQYLETVEDWQSNASLKTAVRHLDAKVTALQTLEELGAAPELIAQFASARQAAETLRADMQATAERVGNARAVRKLAQADNPLRTFASAMGGAMIGGPMGLVAGVGMSALSNPGGLVNRVIQIEALSQQLRRFDMGTERSFRSFVRDSGNRAAQSIPRSAVRTAQRIGDTRRVLTGQVSADDTPPSYEKRSKQIRELAANPELAMNAATRVAEGLDGVAPKTSQVVLQTHLNTINYLNGLLPKPPNSIRSPIRRQAWKPPYSDVVRFERAYRALVEPRTIIADLKDGSLTMDAANALKAVRPRMWDYFRGVAQATIATHPEALDYDAVTRLSLMFDFAGDPTLEPGFIARHQALIAQAPAGTGQPEDQGAAPAQNATNIPGIPRAVQTHTEKITQAL